MESNLGEQVLKIAAERSNNLNIRNMATLKRVSKEVKRGVNDLRTKQIKLAENLERNIQQTINTARRRERTARNRVVPARQARIQALNHLRQLENTLSESQMRLLGININQIRQRVQNAVNRENALMNEITEQNRIARNLEFYSLGAVRRGKRRL